MTAGPGWLILMLLLGLAWLISCWHRCQPAQPGCTAVLATAQRLLRPRTPDDCSACRQQTARSTPHPHLSSPIRPWCEVKSRRGAPKRIATQGFFCPRRTCVYYRITDAAVHALVGDGSHGTAQRIQTFRCQACGATFSARRDTPLYRLKTPACRVGEVVTALAEGLDIAAAGRVFGHRPATITTWLTRAGEHSTALHQHWFQNLHLPHVQLDELHTRLRRRAHTLWLWVAVDPRTKIIPVLQLGARTQETAHAVVHDLQQKLAPGPPQPGTQRATEYGVCGAGQSDDPPKRGRPGAPDLVDGADDAPATSPSGMVAGLLSLRAATCVTPRSAGPGASARRQAPTAAVPATHARDGGRVDEPTLDRAGAPGGSAALSANQCELRLQACERDDGGESSLSGGTDGMGAPPDATDASLAHPWSEIRCDEQTGIIHHSG